MDLGHFGRKEKNGWRSQGWSGSENVNHSGTPNGTASRSRGGALHGGKNHGLREESFSENDATRKDDRERRKQFEAEDFVCIQTMYIIVNLKGTDTNCSRPMKSSHALLVCDNIGVISVIRRTGQRLDTKSKFTHGRSVLQKTAAKI